MQAPVMLELNSNSAIEEENRKNDEMKNDELDEEHVSSEYSTESNLLSTIDEGDNSSQSSLSTRKQLLSDDEEEDRKQHEYELECHDDDEAQIIPASVLRSTPHSSIEEGSRKNDDMKFDELDENHTLSQNDTALSPHSSIGKDENISQSLILTEKEPPFDDDDKYDDGDVDFDEKIDKDIMQAPVMLELNSNSAIEEENRKNVEMKNDELDEEHVSSEYSTGSNLLSIIGENDNSSQSSISTRKQLLSDDEEEDRKQHEYELECHDGEEEQIIPASVLRLTPNSSIEEGNRKNDNMKFDELDENHTQSQHSTSSYALSTIEEDEVSRQSSISSK